MMQSFIKTEFSSSLNETSSSNTNSDIYHQASNNLINNNNKDKCFGSLICRKRLDFDTNTNQNVSYSSPSSSTITLSDKMRHKSITSNKKNTAIVAGTIQMNSVLKQQNQECFNGGETSSLKSANRGQQFVKVPSNTKRNARERKRVRTINDYFSKLQKYLPHSKQPTSANSTTTTPPPPSSLSINASKKLSKVETLKAAIDYIEYLLTFAPSCRYNNSSSTSNSKSHANSSNMTINATSVASLTPCASSASPSSLSTSASSPSSSILSSPSSCFSTSMSSSNSTCEKPSKCNTKATTTKSVCSSPSSSSVLTLTMNKSLKSHQDTSMTPVSSSPLTSTLPITSSNINYECSNNTNSSANFYTTQPNSYQLSNAQSEFRSNTSSYGSYAMESTTPTTSESCYYAQQQYAAQPTQSFANYLPNDTINRMVVDMHVYAESPLIATSSNSCSPLSHNTNSANRNIITNVGLTSPNNHHQFNESHHHNNSMIHNHNHHQTSLQNPYNGYHVAPEIYYN